MGDMSSFGTPTPVSKLARLSVGALMWLRWLDSQGPDGWVDESDLLHDLPQLECESVGWILQVDDRAIMIGPHRSKTNHVLGAIRIPIEAIIETCPILDW